MRALILLLYFPFSLFSECLLDTSEAALGVETCYLKREKLEGARQHGTPVGFQGYFNRFTQSGWYWGLEGEALFATLNGHGSYDTPLRSRFNSFLGEARAGYTFQDSCFPFAAATPYLGFGYLEENNNFKKPTPLSIHFKTRTPFFSFGILTRLNLGPRFEGGLNFKGRLPIDPKCYVSHDPYNAPSSQLIGERAFYRLELPFSYLLNECATRLVTLMPYWELRNYGSRLSYPFDFLKTRLEFSGVSLLFVIRI